MKIKSQKKFHFVHNGKEEFDLDPKTAVEISREAYDHLVFVFGSNWFSVVEGKTPTNVPQSPVNEAVAKAGGDPAPKEDDDEDDEDEDD